MNPRIFLNLHAAATRDADALGLARLLGVGAVWAKDESRIDLRRSSILDPRSSVPGSLVLDSGTVFS
jgi:hypothetical protein